MAFSIETKGRLKWNKFIVSKLKKLLVPFIVLTTVTFIPRTYMSSIADDTIELSLKSFFESFIYYDSLIIPFFWFLQVLLIFLTVSYTLYVLFDRMKINNLYYY